MPSAYAKINLALAVAPPRPDGMHPICSWLARINLADDLDIQPLSNDAPSQYVIEWAPDAPRPTEIDWPVEKDLAVRAHRLLEFEAGRSLPITMTLRKRIPVGAGLGGGSSNAATALLTLRELFQLSITDRHLAQLALTLGADVPFFLPPSEHLPAIVKGVGERIERTPPVAANLILIIPPFSCNTAAVYRQYDQAPVPFFREDTVCTMARAAKLNAVALFNNLADPAMRIAPDLRDLLDRTAATTGCPAHITGSGSAIFVLLEDNTEASKITATLCAALPASCAILPAQLT